jgi:hypothetical protein
VVHRSVKEKGWRVGKGGGRQTIDLASKQKQKEKTRKRRKEKGRRQSSSLLPGRHSPRRSLTKSGKTLTWGDGRASHSKS